MKTKKRDPMNNTDRLYAYILKKQVVSTEDLTRYTRDTFSKSYRYLYSKYLNRLLGQGKIIHVRRGVYAAENPYIEHNPPPDKFLVGSKIRSRYYLGYHTALEFHGSAYSAHNACFIATLANDKFRSFSYGPLSFRCISTRDVKIEIETAKLSDQIIHISSPSRTFVECIYRPDLTLNYEEIAKSLIGLGSVSIKGILSSLKIYNYDILYRKVGYFLQWLRDNSPYYEHFSKKDLELIHANIGKSPMYLIEGKNFDYIGQWNLYVPKDFKNIFIGVK